MSHRWIVHRIERGTALLRDASGSSVAFLSAELLPAHAAEGDEYEVVASVRRDPNGAGGGTPRALAEPRRALRIA